MDNSVTMRRFPPPMTSSSEMLITQKYAVKGWAKTKLIEKPIVFAKKRNIPHPTDATTTMTSLPQLEEAWASNEALAESIWWVLFWGVQHVA